MYTVSNTTATSATLSNLQCNTKYTIWVYARGGQINRTRLLVLPEQFLYQHKVCICTLQQSKLCTPFIHITLYHLSPSHSHWGHCSVHKCLKCQGSIWQWTSSGPAPNCFNTTNVTYCPEGGGESSQELSDPAATETTLTELWYTCYTITVMATAGEHRREGIAFIQPQGILYVYLEVSMYLASVFSAQVHHPCVRISQVMFC